jgi:hypothetical protein
MAKKWAQNLKLKSGSLRATAKRRGMIRGEEKLTASDLETLAKSKNPTTRKRAVLAKTFRKMRKRKS